MADATPTTDNPGNLDNAPTETTQGGEVVETSGASTIVTSDNLASNVVSQTTNDTTQTQEENVEAAKAQALQNHEVEHANDPTPTSDDKTVV